MTFRFKAVNALQAGAVANGNGSPRPLVLAGKFAGIEVANVLIAHAADVHAAASQDGWSALFHASSRGQQELCCLLLNAGADPNQPDKQGLTAADYAKDLPTRSILDRWTKDLEQGTIQRPRVRGSSSFSHSSEQKSVAFEVVANEDFED
eukprot:gnl/MRDRNA2_/MRDRNA2_190345_c0_seq1.p1 gnl/MRDRNA2_/MRDRNA2_190345_c0~~gnl/MRDRNA2_/MRDRNA2_190345_c0_seq1.p1  ORF type:complete len:150 (+),score=26.90 gnl/MRDRNA2_/MRDRNA2_190345_c0_seq1:168-617(+)